MNFYNFKTKWATAVLLLFLSVTTTIINAETVFWKSTTAQNPWTDKGSVEITAWDNDQGSYIEINQATKYQEIDGWGGALNEYGWVAMSVLSQPERDKVLKSLFDTSGCAINIGRISMGANDFSVSFYSCSETPGDYTMSNFSLAKDKINVIPFALAAKAINPAMKFWGSPHSPPAWMKQNNSLIDGSLKTDDTTRKAYALYFQKWVQGMAAENIPIYAVHIQNEPNILGTGYPTCLMSGAEMGTLIKEYIGPQFKNAGLSTEIWVGTLHSTYPDYKSYYDEYIPPTLGDPAVNELVTGVGLQWNALSDAHLVIDNYPSKKTMQTETQCGNFHWTPEYIKDVAPNDWAFGVFTFHRMLQWFRQGISSYSQWNMVLDETGKSNSINGPWPQNSMISINQTTKAVSYNPQFYAVKHFGYYVKPGARRIETSGNFSTGGSNLLSNNLQESVSDGDMMAFQNPDGNIVLVVRNTTSSEKTVAIKTGSSKFKPVLPANSLNTFHIVSNSAIVKNTRVKSNVRLTSQINSSFATFTFSLPSALQNSRALLAITNASGRTINKLNGTVQNGQNSLIWNKRSFSGEVVAPGVYFAHISIGQESMTCPFTLSR
ncbi:MAG TPA: glycoside hydrolase family 30 beta sandwich domain-containing protein [Chitinispirillaceae bacterium]|nr:glycoside hydrolase family 30 beta sandwich domain-containing protein [Chitinispirillaceae bacterium]